jgi:HEPN domain-containing protein
MSTGNFRRFKADYIYVPYNFTELEGGEDEEYMDMLQEDVEYEIEEFTKSLARNLLKIHNKNYGVILIGKEHWKDNRTKVLFEILIDGQDKEGYYNTLSIEVLQVAGYYMGASIDYDYDKDNSAFEDKEFVKVFEKVIDILEKTLSKHFVKYEVAWRASNGETGYRKIH